MTVVELKTVPVRLVLEYAFAAYRINSGYLKVKTEDKLANKDLVSFSVKQHINQIDQNSSVIYHWIPADFKPFEILDEDRANADKIDVHFKKYMFKMLAGKLSQFENDVYTAVCGEEIPITRVGLLAYVPELIERDHKKWAFDKLLKTDYKHSEFFEQKSIEGDMTVLRVIDFKTKSGDFLRSATLGLDGNLYQFFDNKHMIKLNSEGKLYHIKARVKTRTHEPSTGLTMTQLNYVRAKPCQSL